MIGATTTMMRILLDSIPRRQSSSAPDLDLRLQLIKWGQIEIIDIRFLQDFIVITIVNPFGVEYKVFVVLP